VHQIAMMNAVVTGVRSLLDEISPTKLSGENSLALAVQGGASFFSRVLPFRRAQLWSEFATAHEGMVEEDRFTNVMFGRTFARTYLGVSGGTLEAREEARQSAASEAPLAKVGS
jgi:predicted component of type VI protein secretion system